MHAGKENLVRRRFELRGQVQGVGFRPFVYRLATEFRLTGWVKNSSQGAVIEVEGPESAVSAFEAALVDRLPPLAHISATQRSEVVPVGESGFRIVASDSTPSRDREGAVTRAAVTPDAATCADCLAELFDPADRRYRYAFTNCTNCGPRYSIICTIPYDRPATTMAEFTLCPPCAAEYSDQTDRRFHAQPNACPKCGPQLSLCCADRSPLEGDPIRTAAGLLREGQVLAVKGIGGYHLACRADSEDVVARLRKRKLRDGKPLAVMVRDVDAAGRICRLADADVKALTSVAAPIVLAPKRDEHGLAPSIAPGSGTFGVMLPYTPLHHLLFAEGLGPLVMTSANLAGQPLTYEDDDALAVLGDVADAFLAHNRRIFRPIDDSVVFTHGHDVLPIRRARGYAPQPLHVRWGSSASHPSVLAVGGELKSTVCFHRDGSAILSEHLGDLTRPEAYRHFVQAIDRLGELLGFVPDVVAHDLHPQYLSTAYARRLGLPTVAVQHHHAHVASVLAECGEPGPVIGLACDGTGYGTDGAVWGCEVLHCDPGSFTRLGHLDYFPLVGGDLAAIETWRPAAALLRQAYGEDWRQEASAVFDAVPTRQLDMFEQQAAAGANAPPSSSLGRVFDAVAFLLGLCDRNRHEAEAAMAVEAAAGSGEIEPRSYSMEVVSTDGRIGLSLAPMMRDLLADLRSREPVGRMAARFHETVARLLANAAVAAREMTGLSTVAISGGCFANRRLLGRLIRLLETERLRVLYNRQVPSGDGGVSLGQAVAAAWRSQEAAGGD